MALCYAAKTEAMDRIINGGPTMMDKLRVFRGEMPETSQFKQEVVSGRIDRLRAFQITTEERKARLLLKKLTNRERDLLCMWPAVRRQHNDQTQKQWTLTDVAAEFKLMVSEYRQQRDLAAFHLLELDTMQETRTI